MPEAAAAGLTADAEGGCQRAQRRRVAAVAQGVEDQLLRPVDVEGQAELARELEDLQGGGDPWRFRILDGSFDGREQRPAHDRGRPRRCEVEASMPGLAGGGVRGVERTV